MAKDSISSSDETLKVLRKKTDSVFAITVLSSPSAYPKPPGPVFQLFASKLN